MDNVQETMLKRGLLRLGSAAQSIHLSSFSETDVAAVDAYLLTRPDLVLPREMGAAWRLRPEARETLMEEIRAGIERDPERLADVLRPGYLERIRAQLAWIDEILDNIVTGKVSGDSLIETRISLTGARLRDMARYGRDVAPEMRRLATSDARYRSWFGGPEKGTVDQGPGESVS